ncbi:hypothetical protein, partial [Chryseobacterium hispalense]|uniref:hypothetical protein n=1 Tax=Chryseobacterium hispalense TaxID=1453492 RepID=UPI00391DDF12
ARRSRAAQIRKELRHAAQSGLDCGLLFSVFALISENIRTICKISERYKNQFIKEYFQSSRSKYICLCLLK